MATTRKEIVFSAKDTGVADTMQRLRQSASDLGRDLIRDARNFSTSGKESVRYIEEQIKAMERRQKLSQDERKIQLESQREQSSGSKNYQVRQGADDKYKQGMSQLGSDKRQDEMQLALLRELIETTKNKAREEIAEDRKNVTRQIAADKSLDSLGIDEQKDEFESLKKTIQREEIGTISETEREEKGRFGQRAQQAVGFTAGALSSKNETYALAAAISLIPFGVGAGLSMLATKALQGAEERQEARASAGGKRGQAVGLMGGATGYGMTAAQATLQYGNAQDSGSARALGMQGVLTQGTMGMLGQAGGREAMKLNLGMGIDPGALNQLGGFGGYGGLGRGIVAGERESTGGRMFDMLTKSFADTGLMGDKGQQTVNLPTIMSQTTSVLSTLSNTLDAFDPANVMAGMSGLTRLGGSFADPEKLGQRYSQLHQGLTDTSNPFAQALKFSTMQGMKGGAGKSRFELMEMQEKGMTEPGYMKEYLGKLHQMSGGNKDMFMEEVKAAFPQMSFSNTRKIVEGFLKDPNTFDVNPAELIGGKAALKDRNFTGSMMVSTADWAETFADVGEDIIWAMDKVSGAIDELTTWISSP